MKNLIVFIFTFVLALTAFAGEYEYAEVKINSADDIRILKDKGIDIDRSSVIPGSNFNEITVYVTPGEYKNLEQAGYEIEWKPLAIPKDAKAYRFNEDIGDSMLIWQNRYPDICRRIQIGSSVEGRPLWVLKITDSLYTEEAEPEVKFISTMHGDEVTGMEMEMNMIRNILYGYAAGNDTMQFIVDNTELYVMPLMNPDGMANNTRYNSNGYDLNRSFPEGTFYDDDSVNPVLLPEVDAVISWTKQHNFILSTNFHGGAEVANYIFDKDFDVPNYSYAAGPDDDHAYWLAYGYASRNPSLFNSSYFTDGVTNGCAWYSIDGGMQDWNYRYHNDMDMTLEISNTKWPPFSSIPQYWAENRESIFWYLSAAHKGIYGTVTDSLTGEPLSAIIEIEGIGKQYFTDPDRGDYYRILRPGTYTMTVSCEGYGTKTITGIVVTDDTGKFKEATEINVLLSNDSGIEDNENTAEGFDLKQNYPNPFNPETVISFSTEQPGNFKVQIFDTAGHLTETLSQGYFRKGKHELIFNASDYSAGEYFYVVSGLKDPELMLTKKMLIIK